MNGPALIPLVLAVLVIGVVQMLLPPSVTIGPVWLIPVLEFTGIPIAMAIHWKFGDEGRLLRWTMNGYLLFLVLACVMNALLLLSMLQGSEDSGEYLLVAGFAVLAINVLSFGLVYWWLDGGGPAKRINGEVTNPDFLFPQQAMPNETEWLPRLTDYLYTAYTNIIAFSPTDTMPLTTRTKALFTLQSSTAAVTIIVTVSRAINLIPGGLGSN